MIGATQMARGKAGESLTGAWRRVRGQMMMIPAAMCRSVEYLHVDISYVLIGGLMWKTLTEAVILEAVIELLTVKIQPWHL